jgi:hypothetical protein
MSLTTKIAIAAGALTLSVAGVAAAADPPDAADGGLTRAGDEVGIELPASAEAHPTAASAAADRPEPTGAGDPAVDEVELEVEDAAEGDAGIGPVDNHGAEVSAVATSDETVGRAHGEAVSEVARQGHGRP